ncbi:phosphopantetheine-binding protein, partial [Streptomyces sp. NPDC051636]|uniref:acyl carrier protein n=1 Tax=Streptomyces sp. NPDC051636 TaxID=3365663 RepID=UPI0037A5B61F
FADAVTTLDAQGTGAFLEIGPDAALTPMVADTRAVPALRRDRSEPQALVEALTRLPSVDWTAYFGPGRQAVDLPTYAFQHQHYWLASAGRAVGGMGAGDTMTLPDREPEDSEALLAALRAADDAGRAELLGALVRDAIAGVLGHTGADDAVEPDSDFMDLGFTSLLAVEFRDRLTAALGLKLPAAVIYEYGTPEELVEFLAEELEDAPADVPEEAGR